MKIKPGLFALIVGGLVFITLVSFVYANVQRAEAERQMDEAMKVRKSCQEEVDKIRQQQLDALKVAEEAAKRAEEDLLLVKEQKNKK